MSDKSFLIGRTVVGQPGLVYVIAEAGVNHDGDPGVARELVRVAAEAGADAVKFQVFAADRLVTAQAPAAAYQQGAVGVTSQHAMLARLELPHAEFEKLAALAAESSIQFLATPFSPADLDFLVAIGVPALKLASTDIVNGPLIDAAARSGLPVIASTGAARMDEIATLVERFRWPGSGPLALMHCISSYPAREDEANLAGIRTLEQSFHGIVGYSDHTPGTATGGLAVAAGARLIEKHFTLDRSRPGPDHGFSLEPQALAEYIRQARYAAQFVGDGRIGPTPAQAEVRRLARASVVAARTLHPGETISRGALTVKRPGGGISPMEMDALIGRRVLREIPADDMVTWEALEPVRTPAR